MQSKRPCYVTKLQDDDKLRRFFLWINNVLELKTSRLALFQSVSALQHVFEGINSALGLRRNAAVIIIPIHHLYFLYFQVAWSGYFTDTVVLAKLWSLENYIIRD